MRRTSQDFDLPAALIPSTPYMLAAGVGSSATQDRRGVAAGLQPVSRLVIAGAEVNVKNGRGQTPLRLAAKREDRKATADVLRSLGARD